MNGASTSFLNSLTYPLPKGFWKDVSNHKLFLDDLAIKYNFKSLDDWNNITYDKFIKNKGGKSFLRFHKHSLKTALASVYPHHHWDINSRNVIRGYWNSLETQRKFMDNLSKKYNISEIKDWECINRYVITENGGARLLDIYKGNIKRLLTTLYPTEDWEKYRMNREQRINDFSTKEFLLQIQRVFMVQKKSDWYRISFKRIIKLPGGSIFQSTSNLYLSLCKHHPDQSWDEKLIFSREKKATQRWLLICFSQLFPQYHLIEEYHLPNIYFRSSAPLDVDLFIPDLNYAIDYHGEQHYDEISGVFSPTEIYISVDQEKQKICTNAKFSYFIIPFWWDKLPQSLLSFIQ